MTGRTDNLQSPGTGRVVFACSYHEPLRSTVLPLARRLRRGATDSPIVLLEDDACGHMGDLCTAAGVAFRHVPERSPRTAPLAGGLSTQPPALPSTDQGTPGWRLTNGLPHRLARLGRTFWRVRRQIARHAALLAELDAAVVVLLDDRTLHGCRWVRAAQTRGLHVVVVQWAATHRADVLASLRSARLGQVATGGFVRRFERYAAKRVPQGMRCDRKQPIWWVPPEVTLGYHWLGAYPKTTPWAYGGGNSTVVTVLGEAWKTRLVADGVPADKLVVTGHPEQDLWYRYAAVSSQEDVTSVVRQLGFAADRRLVTIVAPALALRAPGEGREGDIGVDDLRADLQAAIGAVHDLGPQFVPVVKAHPRDSADALALLQSGSGQPLCVVSDYPLERLIRASHAMACQWSTAVLAGLALRVPVLLFDFHRSPSAALWKDVDGLPHAESIGQFRRMLADCLLDPAGRDRLLADQDPLVADYLRCDGQATARIAQVIRQQMCR